MSTHHPAGNVRSSSESLCEVPAFIAARKPGRQPLGPAGMGFTLTVVAVLLAAVPQANGQVYWSTTGTVSDWSQASNWLNSNNNNSLPTPLEDAFIANGGTATITLPGAVCNNLWLGDPASTTQSGTVLLSGMGVLTAATNEYVGNIGPGTFYQSGGTNNLTSASNATLFLGSTWANMSGSGGYTLSGSGVLSANNEQVGDYGVGTFSQSGGVNAVANNLTVYSNSSGPASSYTLSSGSLSANQLNVGSIGMGVFAQSGGTNTIATNLYVYSNQGPASSYTLSAGSLSANGEYVCDSTGGSGIGTFTHSGGTNTVSGNLTIFSNSGAASSYTLSGSGVLSVTNNENVGGSGNGNGLGTFMQNGGMNTVGGTLCVYSNSGAASSYTLSGGSLSALNECVGSSGFGLFTHSGGTNTVTNYLTISGGTYNLTAGLLAAPYITANGVSNGVFNLGGGTLMLGSGSNTTATDMSLTLAGGVISTGSNAATISGALSGSGALTILGSSNLTLSNSNINTFTGATTIGTSATLTLQGASVLQYSTVTTSASNTLTFNTSQGATTFYVGGLAGSSGSLSLLDISAVPVTLSIVGSGSSSFSGAITGGGSSLTVSGGSLDLYGNTELYSGPTTVTAGLLKLDFSQTGSPLTNILNTDPLVLGGGTMGVPGSLGGGTLSVLGISGTNISQTFKGLTLNQGCSSIIIATSGSHVALGTISRNPGSTLDMTLPSGSLSIVNGVSTTTTDTNGILGAFVTATTGGVTNWAASTGAAGYIFPYTAYTAVNIGTVATLSSSQNATLTGTQAQLTSAKTCNTLVLSSTTGSFTMNSTGALTLAGGGLINNCPTGSITGGTLEGSSGTNTLVPLELIVITPQNLTIGSVIADNGAPTALTKAGSGILALTGNNTYTGPTTVGAGTLYVGTGGSGESLASPTITLCNNTTLVFSHADALTYGGAIGGVGSLTQMGSGSSMLTLTGASNTYTGPTTVSSGTLQISSGSASGDFLASSGVSLSGSAALLIFNGSGQSTYGGVISGRGNLLQTGSGMLTLTGSNTYTGKTTVSACTLQVGNGGSGEWLSSGSIALSNNAALIFDGADQPTYAGAISGTGSLTQMGAGVLTLLGSNTFTGSTTISAGTLQLGNGIASGTALSSSTVANSSALVFDLPGSSTFSGAVNGSGSLTQAGTGLLTLTGSNTYAGGTSILSGTLQFANSQSVGGTGAVSNNGGLVFSQPGALTYGGTISGNGSIAQTGPGTLTLSGPVSGSSLTQSGSGVLILTGNNTYTAATTVSAGALQVGNGGSGESLSSPAINVGSGAALLFSQSDSLVYSGSISDSGSITQSGSGMLTLSGAISGTGSLTQPGPGLLTLTSNSNTYGATTISAGTLQLGDGNNPGNLGTGKLLDNGTLAFNLPANSTFGGVISGNGSLAQVGPNMLTLTNSSNSYGATTISSGTLQLGNGTLAGTAGTGAVVNDGTLIFNLPGNPTLGGAISGNGTLIFNLSGNPTFNGTISGQGYLVQAGTGVLTLTGSNPFTGSTTISAGTLQLGSGGTSGILAGGGNVEIDGALVLNLSNSATMSNGLSGSGMLLKISSGAVALTGDMSGFEGQISVLQGQLALGASTAPAASQYTVGNGAALQLNGATIDLGSAYATIWAMSGGTVQYSNATILGGDLWGPGVHILAGSATNTFNKVTIDNGAVIQQNSPAMFKNVENKGQIIGSGGLVLAGGDNNTGTIILSGINDVSSWGSNNGVISIQSGGLLNNHLSNLVIGGGVFTINSGGTLNADSAGEGVMLDLQGGLLINNGTLVGTTSASGATVSGSGSFGLIDLSNYATLAITSTAVVNTASVAVSNGTITGNGVFAAPTTINAATPATMSPVLTANPASAPLTLSGPIGGSGALLKSGTGTLILSDTNTYTGGTVIAGGILEIACTDGVPAAQSLTVDAGGTFIYDPSAVTASAVESAASPVAAVPEPSALALLAAAGAVGAAFAVRRRTRRRSILGRDSRGGERL